MKRNISALLSFLLLLTITTSPFETRSEVKTGQAVQTTVLLTDIQSDELVGRGDGFKQFLYGVGCGLGIVATVAGFAGGAFTGGLTAAVSGMVLAGATATACAEVM
jgi:hypothetical protein